MKNENINNNHLKIILIGPPGSGKGTQALKLTSKFNIPHISSGDVLRSEVAKQSDFGKQIKVYMDKGEIGPVELITEIMLNHIHNHCSKGFILDGFPRTIYQALKLKEKHDISVAIFINVSEKEIISRITGRRICKSCNSIYHIKNNPPVIENKCNNCGTNLTQRSDDNEETILNRIKIYNEETKPVIDFYQNADLLHKINGEMDSESIFNNIIKILPVKS